MGKIKPQLAFPTAALVKGDLVAGSVHPCSVSRRENYLENTGIAHIVDLMWKVIADVRNAQLSQLLLTSKGYKKFETQWESFGKV